MRVVEFPKGGRTGHHVETLLAHALQEAQGAAYTGALVIMWNNDEESLRFCGRSLEIVGAAAKVQHAVLAGDYDNEE